MVGSCPILLRHIVSLYEVRLIVDLLVRRELANEANAVNLDRLHFYVHNGLCAK